MVVEGLAREVKQVSAHTLRNEFQGMLAGT